MANSGGKQGKAKAAKHESFLQHARYRWLRVALLLSAVAVAAYVLSDFRPRPSGGTWLGYTLGVVSAGLILWLTLIGIRKRAITSGNWSLKAWVSAHVYLGLSLLVLATLHTGFSFGWNVHTLAYALMVLVIVSGMFGVTVYATLPSRLSANRGEITQRQMLETVHATDRQLEDAAQPLDQAHAAIIRHALERTDLSGGFWSRLTGIYPGDGTRAAVRRWRRLQRKTTAAPSAAFEQVEALLQHKVKTLDQLRRHVRLRSILEVWLKVHIPATFALLAALTAHIVSVFFYW